MFKKGTEGKISMTSGKEMLRLAHEMARGGIDADEYFAAVERSADELVDKEASAFRFRGLGGN